MIPGSLGDGELLDIRGSLRTFRKWVRQYVWLWIAYQTIKGLTTTTFIWGPLLYMYLK